VLIAAVSAPGILAGGLLAGELTGYERTAAQQGMRVDVVARMAFEPVLVPAPARPERWYEGVVPAIVRVVAPAPEPPKQAEVVVPSAPAVVERRTAEPVQKERACAGEWVDTWLWDVCREHERRPGREVNESQEATEGQEVIEGGGADAWEGWPA
jgi:hypothetical protein